MLSIIYHKWGCDNMHYAYYIIRPDLTHNLL